MRPIDEAYWQDYFDTHNNRRFVELVDRFYAPDADFENMRVAVKGREDIIAFLEESNEFVRITLVPRLIITQGTVTATELDCILRAEKDMPEFLLGPMEKGDEVTMRMAAVYHMDGDRIARARVYWGRKV